jgi:hypothetical protein
VADADDPSGHGHDRPPCYDIGYNIGRRTPNGQGVGERREEEGRTGTRRPGPARRARTSGTPKKFTGLRVHGGSQVHGVHRGSRTGRSGVHPPETPPFF